MDEILNAMDGVFGAGKTKCSSLYTKWKYKKDPLFYDMLNIYNFINGLLCLDKINL